MGAIGVNNGLRLLTTVVNKDDLSGLYSREEMSVRQIAARYSISAAGVSKLLKTYGIPARKEKAKGIDISFFETMTPDLAYYLGLMATDGVVKTDGVIGLKLIDRDVIDWVAATIGYQNTMSAEMTQAGNVAYGLYFRSVRVQKILAGYGITKQKTHTLTFPENIPDEYLCHYIRGVFDGDGSIFPITGKRSWTVSLTCASLPFLTRYKGLIEGLVGGDRKVHKNSKRQAYHYSFTDRRAVLKFAEWIYPPGSFGMERKRAKFRELGANV